MSLAVVFSRALAGLDAPLVRVEVHTGGGLPCTNIVGLPEKEVREARDRVRAALARLPERECRMLLLCAEGYRYRDIAAALNINEASVGTLLARAKRAFRDAYGAYGDDADAS